MGAQLGALKRQAKLQLQQRLASGRLLSLSPGDFVCLVHAHRIVHGPVPLEDLRVPFSLAFAVQMHHMEPRQIASCIETLWRYAGKKNREIFLTAYDLVATALEESAEMPPAQIAST